MLVYFQDYENNGLHDRKIMFNVLSTVKTYKLNKLIKETRQVRALLNKDDEEDFIDIKNEFKQELEGVLNKNSNFKFF